MKTHVPDLHKASYFLDTWIRMRVWYLIFIIESKSRVANMIVACIYQILVEFPVKWFCNCIPSMFNELVACLADFRSFHRLRLARLCWWCHLISPLFSVSLTTMSNPLLSSSIGSSLSLAPWLRRRHYWGYGTWCSTKGVLFCSGWVQRNI